MKLHCSGIPLLLAFLYSEDLFNNCHYIVKRSHDTGTLSEWWPATYPEAIGDKIEDLKKGRTEVLESGHTLILGWSDKMLNMIDQLCLANESAGGKAIVILAERDKQDMEEDIHKQIRNLRGSRILCRSDHATCRHALRPLRHACDHGVTLAP